MHSRYIMNSDASTFRAGVNPAPTSCPNLGVGEGFTPSQMIFHVAFARFSALPPFLLLLGALFALTPTAGARAQEQEPEVTLPAGGIRYPGGYDPNTVGTVEGRVAALESPQRGPVSFRLESAGEAYVVLAAPTWYWADRKFAIANGDLVRVKGSKTMGADGNLYLVAREITAAGAEKPEVLRDAGGKPVWSGCGPGGCGGRGRR